MRIFCNAKDSHIFPTKNNSVFVIILNFNETLTNDLVNFEQLAESFTFSIIHHSVVEVKG